MTAALKLDLSPRVFSAALLATMAVLAGAGWLLVVSPKHHKAATLSTEIANDQTSIAAAKQAVSRPTAGPAEQTALSAALPDALAMPQLVDQLNALADQSGVTLDSVTPAAASPGAGYIEVPLTVVVDGRYFGVEKFLHLVRNQVSLNKAKLFASGRLFDVTGIELDQTEPAPNVTATLQMGAYYFSPASTAPAPATTTTDETTTDATSTTPSP